MQHNALVAYERSNGRYNLHFSPHGAYQLQLQFAITSRTPFGSDLDRPEIRAFFEDLRETTADTDTDPVPPIVEPLTGRVEADPIARDRTLQTINEEFLDFRAHEALVVVSTEYDVTPFVTLWFGFEAEADCITDSRTVGNGVLRTVRWDAGRPVDTDLLPEKYRGLRCGLARDLDARHLSISEAESLLVAAHEVW